MNCFDNNLENNSCNFKYNAGKLQEILNKTMQRIISIIISSYGKINNTIIMQLYMNCGMYYCSSNYYGHNIEQNGLLFDVIDIGTLYCYRQCTNSCRYI